MGIPRVITVFAILIPLLSFLSPCHGDELTVNSPVSNSNGKIKVEKRLPPQIAYAGHTLIIHLADFFKSDSFLNYLMYCLDDTEDGNGQQIHCPYWIEFDHTVPLIAVTPPKNTSFHEIVTDARTGKKEKHPIIPAYSLVIQANSKITREVYEEDVLIIVAKTCFHKCPSHFGVGCTDWELWLVGLGVYGILTFITGFYARHFCSYIQNLGGIADAKRKWREEVAHLRNKGPRAHKFSKLANPEDTDSDSDLELKARRQTGGAAKLRKLKEQAGIVTIAGRRGQLKNYFESDEEEFEEQIKSRWFWERFYIRHCAREKGMFGYCCARRRRME